MLSPPIAARMEEWDDLSSLWIASFEAISTALIAVAAGQRQIVCIIQTASRLGQHMVNSEAHELPSFVGMAILTTVIRALAHDSPRSGRHRHNCLNGYRRRV